MNVGFHYQGIFGQAELENGQVKRITVDGMEVNILPEMLPEITKEYRRLQAVLS